MAQIAILAVVKPVKNKPESHIFFEIFDPVLVGSSGNA